MCTCKHGGASGDGIEFAFATTNLKATPLSPPKDIQDRRPRRVRCRRVIVILLRGVKRDDWRRFASTNEEVGIQPIDEPPNVGLLRYGTEFICM